MDEESEEEEEEEDYGDHIGGESHNLLQRRGVELSILV